MRFRILGACALASALLVGCASTTQSARIRVDTDAQTLADSLRDTRPAIIYALPLRRVKLIVTGTPVPPVNIASAVANLAGAQAAKTAADNTVNTARANVSDLTAQNQLAAGSVNQSTLNAAQQALELALGEQRRANAAVAAAEAALVAQQTRAIYSAAPNVAAANAHLSTAREALRRATQAHARAEEVVTELERLQAQNPDSVSPATLQAAQALRDHQADNMARAQAGVEVAELQLALAQARQGQTVGATPPEFSLGLRFELMAPVPDAEHFYQATFDHEWQRDDAVTITTDASGLLSNSQVSTIDRTADILIDLAGISGLANPPTPSVPTAMLEDRTTAPNCAPGRSFTRELIFDPNDHGPDGEVQRAAAWLQNCLGLTLRIENPQDFPDWTLHTPTPQRAAQRRYRGRTAPAVSPASPPGQRMLANGLVYRRPVPYVIEVLRGEDTLATTVALAPQGGPFGVIPYEPRAFVTSVTNVTFDAGQPTVWHTNNPSELAAAFRIPVAAARALIEVPASLVRLRVDYSSQQTQLIESQRNYICALETLARAEGRETANNCPTE